MISGLYYIRNKKNDKFYVGSSDELPKREYYHFNRLKHNKHPNCHLQNAWNKYGKEAFSFETSPVEIEQLLVEEQKVLDLYWPTRRLYNIAPIAGASFRNRQHTEQTKIKMSQSSPKIWKGRHHSSDTIDKMSKTNTKIFAYRRLLTEDDIRDIRISYNPTINGGVGTRTLAKRYGVSRMTVIRILKGTRYRQVK